MNQNELSGAIIGAAIEVHRLLGPGLLESVYEEALAIELEERSLPFVKQLEVSLECKARNLRNLLRLDLLAADAIIVEVKSVERILPVHEVQLLSYLRLTGKKLGLLVNFNSTVLGKSVRRIVNNL